MTLDLRLQLAAAMCVLAACNTKPAPEPCRSASPCVDTVGHVEAFSVENANAVAEVAPWPFELNGRRGMLVSSAHSSLCYSAQAINTAASFRFDAGDCAFLVGGATEREPDAGALTEATDFRRNYEGALSAEVTGALGQQSLWSVTHGENKNNREPHGYYPGTVNLDVGPDCWSGYDAATDRWRECWEAYNGFVGISRTGADGVTADFGPIIWPSGGYISAAGVKASEGLRHPSSLIWQNSLYVFYEDETFASEGIKVARAGLEDLPVFTAFDGAGFNSPALPAGFQLEHMRSFYGVPGPVAKPLFDIPEFDSVRFSVAAVRGSSLFLGVEERVSEKVWQLVLRSSADLMHWSAPTVLEQLSAPTWSEGALNYPILVNRDGLTGVIDADDFSIVGTHISSPRRVHLSVRLPASGP